MNLNTLGISVRSEFEVQTKHKFFLTKLLAKFTAKSYPVIFSRFSTWQTMLSNTSLMVDPKNYPEGFVLVKSAAPTDDLFNVVEEGNKC